MSRLTVVVGAFRGRCWLAAGLLLMTLVPVVWAQGDSPGGEDGDEVVLNFEGADVREVIHSLATALGINYTIDPRVQGQVTVRTTGKISRRELFPVFHQVLRVHGIAAVKVGNLYQIVPLGEAKTKAGMAREAAERGEVRAEGAFVVELVRVERIAAEEIAKVLGTFVSPGGEVVAYPRANLLVVSDLEANVAR